MVITLASAERKEAHRFLASMGLYLRHNNIFRMVGGCEPLTRSAILAVQTLWDAEWERLKPSIEALVGAENEAYTRGPRAGLPMAPKEKGRSPMRLFIRDLAPCFTALFDKRASVTRINACEKGGAFPDFVRAVARQWKIKPPSVEVVAQALK